jgi:hypothetical protein
MLTYPRQLIPPLVCQGVRIRPFFWLVITTCVSRLITIWCLRHFLNRYGHLPSVYFHRSTQCSQATFSGSRSGVDTSCVLSITISWEWELSGSNGMSCWHSSSSDTEESNRTHRETRKIPPNVVFTRDLISKTSPAEYVFTMITSAICVTCDCVCEQ